MNIFNQITAIFDAAAPREIKAIRSQIAPPKDLADLYRLIYANGQNSPATIVMHTDDAHGWLQVPLSLVARLDI